jgi:TrpR family trp operon transcriptional repressor
MMRLSLGLGYNSNREENESKGLEELINILLSIRSKDEMGDFLKGILTAKELLEIPNRLKIIKMLKKGISQHEIAQNLGVGVMTVTRGSKELQGGRFKNV